MTGLIFRLGPISVRYSKAQMKWVYTEAKERQLYTPTAKDALSIEPEIAAGEAALNQYDFNWIADNIYGPLAHISHCLPMNVWPKDDVTALVVMSRSHADAEDYQKPTQWNPDTFIEDLISLIKQTVNWERLENLFLFLYGKRDDRWYCVNTTPWDLMSADHTARRNFEEDFGHWTLYRLPVIAVGSNSSKICYIHEPYVFNNKGDFRYATDKDRELMRIHMQSDELSPDVQPFGYATWTIIERVVRILHDLTEDSPICQLYDKELHADGKLYSCKTTEFPFNRVCLSAESFMQLAHKEGWRIEEYFVPRNGIWSDKVEKAIIGKGSDRYMEYFDDRPILYPEVLGNPRKPLEPAKPSEKKMSAVSDTAQNGFTYRLYDGRVFRLIQPGIFVLAEDAGDAYTDKTVNVRDALTSFCKLLPAMDLTSTVDEAVGEITMEHLTMLCMQLEAAWRML